MFIDYIQAAMRHANYELLADGEGVVATIPGFKGLMAHGVSVEACRDELQEVLQNWMLVRMDHGLRLPVLDGLNLNSDRAGKRPSKAVGRKQGQRVA